jgi:hypothetical protein
MAQADQTVQNATFPTVRADINNNLAALFSDNSGATAPTVTVAYQDWIDTSGANPLWKKRNAANNAWITLGTISASTIAFNGTLPDQSGNAGEYLTTNGTVASWAPTPTIPVEVKAWVNFNGSGTVAIRASFNVSSITDNGTGDYTINFTAAMADANYAVVGSGRGGSTPDAVFSLGLSSDAYTASQVRVATSFIGGTTTGRTDLPTVCVSVFR